MPEVWICTTEQQSVSNLCLLTLYTVHLLFIRHLFAHWTLRLALIVIIHTYCVYCICCDFSIFETTNHYNKLLLSVKLKRKRKQFFKSVKHKHHTCSECMSVLAVPAAVPYIIPANKMRSTVLWVIYFHTGTWCSCLIYGCLFSGLEVPPVYDILFSDLQDLTIYSCIAAKHWPLQKWYCAKNVNITVWTQQGT